MGTLHPAQGCSGVTPDSAGVEIRWVTNVLAPVLSLFHHNSNLWYNNCSLLQSRPKYFSFPQTHFPTHLLQTLIFIQRYHFYSVTFCFFSKGFGKYQWINSWVLNSSTHITWDITLAFNGINCIVDKWNDVLWHPKTLQQKWNKEGRERPET